MVAIALNICITDSSEQLAVTPWIARVPANLLLCQYTHTCHGTQDFAYFFLDGTELRACKMHTTIAIGMSPAESHRYREWAERTKK